MYEKLGVRRVINGRGVYTDLGGSSLEPDVWAAATEANSAYASVPELIDAASARAAKLLHTDAARVVPGASAALVLTGAALLAGSDPKAIELLPSVTSGRRAIVIQARHRYKYDHLLPLSGAHLRVAGTAATSADELHSALKERDTVGQCFPAHLDGTVSTVPLETALELASQSGKATIVDAAFLCYPIGRMRELATSNAEYVIFSAKYFGGPNAGGIVFGSADAIAALTALDFTRFESSDYLRFGRAFKMDRAQVVATVAALENWLSMDHAARFASYAGRVGALGAALSQDKSIVISQKHFTMDEEVVEGAVNCLTIDTGSPDRAARIEAYLAKTDPALLVHIRGGTIVVDVENMGDDESHVAARLLSEAVGVS